jgi:hypothetical protein
MFFVAKSRNVIHKAEKKDLNKDKHMRTIFFCNAYFDIIPNEKRKL